MKIKNKKRFFWITFFSALIFNLLYWNQKEGISFPITVFVVIGIGFLMAKLEGVKVAKSTYWLLLPIAFFSIFNLFRLEPMTQFLNHAIVLVLMILLANSLQGGLWWRYGFIDYFSSAFGVALSAIFKPFPFFFSGNDKEQEESKEKNIWRRVFTGFLIALPILLVFSFLFSQADAVFSANLDNLFSFLKNFDFSDLIGRLIFISFFTFIFLGVFLHALSKDHDEEISNDKNKKGIIGFIETLVVQISVILLFLSFVFIQFKYFFGGDTNIDFTGYTYAEYARRGFNELVFTTILTVALVILISFFSKTKTDKQQNLIKSLSTLLLSLNFVLLFSAMKRLNLYESAYGFSRVRTYTHVFIICLAVFLIAIVALDWFRKQKFYAFSVLIFSMVFIASLNIVNVDSLIASKNIEHYLNNNQLDTYYLQTLSVDVVKPLTEAYADHPEEEIKEAIICHALNTYLYSYDEEFYVDYSWASFHFSRAEARSSWDHWLENQNSDLQDLFEGKISYEKMDSISRELEYDCFSYWID